MASIEWLVLLDKECTVLTKLTSALVRQLSGTTAQRPTTGTSPGDTYFDTTLNKPVWRNAGNTGWVDATGSAA